MAKIEKDLYKYLFENLDSLKLSKNEVAKPDASIEREVTKIFTQAHNHRRTLVFFYIVYTVISSVFIFGLIGLQAYYRVHLKNDTFEIAPQWAVNILVTGMFAQFVGLLTIVTQRVWDFKPFLTYHNQMKHHDESSDLEVSI